MKELEIECHKLGIPAKTRHNEVAPNQFELAPIFENCNLANDHNQLVMDLMKRIARKHHFNVLLHEKPYSGVNGSGKHNNWSLCTAVSYTHLSEKFEKSFYVITHRQEFIFLAYISHLNPTRCV